ncbi:MAG: 50S ribosomal protein L21 [Phycisphaerae bacterium]|nr:50S ribosomal protein L21 [Phycisphaerae bacterium]
MYAIIEDGGKQYKVQQGEKVCIELRDLVEGETAVEFDRVLFVRNDDGTEIGKPYITGAKVLGEVVNTVAGPKVYPMQFRRRKNSRRRIGHRQKYLEVQITDIKAN